MRKVKCSNGHFYDADRFAACPICGAESTIQLSAPKKSHPDAPAMTQPLLPAAGIDSAAASSDSQRLSTPPMPIEEDSPAAVSSQSSSLKDSIPPTAMLSPSTTELPISPEQTDVPKEVKSELSYSTDTLEAAVAATASKNTKALPKTMAYYDFDEVEPPVGWLICVIGSHAGRAFQCKAGRNRIGRNLDMDICLAEDPSISRDTHAIIIYDPKRRTFHLQVGTSDGLTYHNGDLLFDHEELHAYDKIELGKAEFLFLPLCGEQFTWDDYTKKD